MLRNIHKDVLSNIVVLVLLKYISVKNSAKFNSVGKCQHDRDTVYCVIRFHVFFSFKSLYFHVIGHVFLNRKSILLDPWIVTNTQSTFVVIKYGFIGLCLQVTPKIFQWTFNNITRTLSIIDLKYYSNKYFQEFRNHIVILSQETSAEIR